MRYRLLGTAQAFHRDGTPVALGGARLRALLTVLALRAGRSVPVGVLVDEVWDGDPPADAVAALQALVGRLRRALGREAVVSSEGGYRLTADEDDVDLHRFGRLAAEGARALEDGDAGKAAVLLDEALALWQGPALADLPDRASEALRWDTRRLEARRARLTAALALGRAEEALPELAGLCEEFPLDEPLQALRIRALRDASRTAEALVAYDEVRRDLATRLGTDPGQELRTLHDELLHEGGGRGPGAGRWGTGGAAHRTAPRADSLPAAPDTTPHTYDARPSPERGSARGESADWQSDGVRRDGSWPGEGPPEGERSGQLREDSGPGPSGRREDQGRSPDHDHGWADGQGGRQADGQRGRQGDAQDDRQADGQATSPADRHTTHPGASRNASAHAAARGNLRARLTSFVGREADIEALRADLTGARLVTLLGPGGAGKTRLSQEAAERASHAWPDGVWLAELAPVNDPDTVAEAVLTSLGARETVLRGAGAEEFRAVDRQVGEPLVRLAEHCARRHMLLLLDNCEHVIDAAATLAEELLSRCPNLTVLATSREPLGVPGEVVRPVEPLSPRSAHRLFTERARSVRPDFDPEADPEAVAEICRRLDGLPLAIELAAARLRLLSPRQIADRLDDRFRLLTSGSRTVLPRQQTLRAVVDWSWDLLDEPERAVLRRLSVFAGGCALPAVEAVCATTPPDTPATPAGPPPDAPAAGPAGVRRVDMPALLGALIDKSLVVAAPSADGDMRYRLLETVAEYASERLDQAGDRGATERRHLVHYRELARTTDPRLRGPDQLAAIALLQLEHENLRTALRRAVAARDEHEVLCMVLSLAWFWSMRDMRAEGRQWATAAASLGPDPFAPPAEPAPPLYLRCTDLPPPMAEDQLIEARRQVRVVEMVTLEHAEDEWAAPERQEWLRSVATVYRAGLPQTCRFPASLWFFSTLMSGGDARLREVLDETVAACERFGFDWELAGALQMRANILANRGAWADDADRDADRALEIYDALGDAWGRTEALSARGEARERRGQYELAVTDFATAIGHAESLGARSQIAVLRARMASSMFETDRAAEGEAILRAVLDDSNDVSHESLIAARLFLALRLGRTGRREEARQHLDVIAEAFQHETLAVFQGFIKGAYAWLDCQDGRYAEALEAVRVALRASHSILTQMVAPHMAAGYLMTAAWALAGLAGLAGHDKERAREAARLLGASEALTPEGHFRPPTEQELFTASRRAVLSALGNDEKAFATAYAEGTHLSLEQAAARV
ncbi:AfsR/SARP family transcriptional regulator [Streptomyces liangshanensis]|uniref:AfsR/SARP family transcriptional regulator n=1 Tax=Streptomyces liangshanensis TaxID=2717324 RepID=UPI0036D99D5E